MDKHGFTLTEVIIAALILAMTVAGILWIFTTERGIVARTGRRVQAMDFARQTLEELRNEVKATMDDTGEPLEIQGWGSYEDLSGDFGTKFGGQKRYKVEPVAGVDPSTGYRSVTVEIKWSEPSE